MAKDYSGWNGRKLRLEQKHIDDEAAQKEARVGKSKKNKNKGGVSHRLNRAESLVCDLSRCLEYFVKDTEERLGSEEIKDINQKGFWTKFRLSDADDLLKRADKLMKEEGV